MRLPEAEATLISTIIYPNRYNIRTTSPINALAGLLGFEPKSMVLETIILPVEIQPCITFTLYHNFYDLSSIFLN